LRHPPVFFDIEASSLEGVPIEIGWAFADAKTGSIQAESYLIQPPDAWHLAASWDEEAERLHGIGQGHLQREGNTASHIMHRMNEVLDGAILYSDAPAWDGEWMRMIVDAGCVAPRFSVSHTEAHGFIGTLARDGDWRSEDVLALVGTIAATYPRTHRAADDARHLAALWFALSAGPGRGRLLDCGAAATCGRSAS
jgi:hypothetical protein